MIEGRHIHVTGIVQGVGFRPFVYALATELQLTGWVCNSAAGVDIALDGPPPQLERFAALLQTRAPVLARVDTVAVQTQPPNGFVRFEIHASRGVAEDGAGALQPVPPDVATCDDCLRELFDPVDRRYRYPFINCTNCGPRFTIIDDLPYDRPLTTMAPFALCAACAAEYADPANRRFHAQPVACPRCGPHIWLEDSARRVLTDRADSDATLAAVQRALLAGQIVAVKGLGGFHLACDARNALAVAELRRRKRRPDRPLAVMLPDLATARAFCVIDATEAALLGAAARPIVILHRRANAPIALEVAPDQPTLGVMLPYTPLHHLLFARVPGTDVLPPTALVMTSGNLSEEPIAFDNDEARARLAPLADLFLLHERAIRTRCDDSLWHIAAPATPQPLRRARGYAPQPLRLPWSAPPVLGVGGELKNAFCLATGRDAFLSQHIGDMQNYETLQAFEASVAHFARLFRVTPALLAYDLHPDYLATQLAQQWAAERGLPAVGVQHHHAHIAAGMAEQRLPGDRPVIGVAFDGTGYGSDGTIWGGEFLVADYAGFARAAWLQPFPLPGGERAVREPWRGALACLRQAGLAWSPSLPPVAHAGAAADVLAHQLRSGLNVPLTSSAGRLFDAVAALLGVRQTVSYEAQAAIMLEARSDSAAEGRYTCDAAGGPIDLAPLFAELVADVQRGVATPTIAGRFHNTLAAIVCDVCCAIRRVHGLQEVVLSGGVWQNRLLLAKSVPLLEAAGFAVYLHRLVPPNDGGLALGQVAVAAWQSMQAG